MKEQPSHIGFGLWKALYRLVMIFKVILVGHPCIDYEQNFTIYILFFKNVNVDKDICL